MNGLEALENWYNTEKPKPIEYSHHYNIIKKDLKILQILKKHKVDLNWIYKNIIEEDICPTQTEVDEYYFQHNKESYITLEEMQQIVDWLKEE